MSEELANTDRPFLNSSFLCTTFQLTFVHIRSHAAGRSLATGVNTYYRFTTVHDLSTWPSLYTVQTIVVTRVMSATRSTSSGWSNGPKAQNHSGMFWYKPCRLVLNQRMSTPTRCLIMWRCIQAPNTILQCAVESYGGTSLPCTVSRDHRDFASHMQDIVWNSIIGRQYTTPGLKLPGRSRLSRILNNQFDIQQFAKHQTVNPSYREFQE